MAKYLGPKLKLCRREGGDLFLKSGSIEHKCKINKDKIYNKKTRLSDYAIRLREKQKIKIIYGVLEKQFHNYYKKSVTTKGNTGENLLIFLELRLDNIIYRLGWASTRNEARQIINHRFIMINNKSVNIPSYQVSLNQTIKVKDKYKNKYRILKSIELNREKCTWLYGDNTKLEGNLIRLPNRQDICKDFKEHLIVELYSK